jgi:hypothetical protein
MSRSASGGIWNAGKGTAHLHSPMGPSLRRRGVWQWQDGKKIFCGSAQNKVRDCVRKERCPDIRMNSKAEAVVIPMMLQAQQHPIFQGVNSPRILVCPRGRTRKRTVSIGGIGERISDQGRKSYSIPLDNNRISLKGDRELQRRWLTSPE